MHLTDACQGAREGGGGRTRLRARASSGTLDAVLTLLKSSICVQSQLDSVVWRARVWLRQTRGHVGYPTPKSGRGLRVGIGRVRNADHAHFRESVILHGSF